MTTPGLRLSRALECLTLFGLPTDSYITTLTLMIYGRILNPTFARYGFQFLPLWFIRRNEAAEFIKLE